MVLKKGMKGPEVEKLQHKLTQAGFNCGPIDGIYGPATESAIRGLQLAHGLVVDGIVGPQTWNALDDVDKPDETEALDSYQEVLDLPSGMPRNALEKRFSDALRLMQTCDDGQGFRYCGWANAYLYDGDEFKSGSLGFPAPLGSVRSVHPGHDLKAPIHGGTCSPFAGWFMAWWLCANQDYNFRVGRSAFYIVDWPHDKVYKGTKIPGYADYCEKDGIGMRKASLSTLYKKWEWLNGINVIPMSHHIVFALKVGGDGLWLEDPHNPGQPLTPGIYRFGADGNYPVIDGERYYSGIRQTWRRFGPRESVGQKWNLYRVANNDPSTGCPDDGPFGCRSSWDIKV